MTTKEGPVHVGQSKTFALLCIQIQVIERNLVVLKRKAANWSDFCIYYYMYLITSQVAMLSDAKESFGQLGVFSRMY